MKILFMPAFFKNKKNKKIALLKKISTFALQKKFISNETDISTISKKKKK